MDDGHLTTQELITQLEAKDRRFRAAGVLFGLLLTAAVIVLLFVGLSTLRGVRSQLTAQKTLLDSQQQILAKIQASSKQSAAQTQDLQNHIDCIVELFQQPNHNQLSINQLQGCKLTTTSSGSNSTNKSGGSNATTTTTPHNAGTAPSNNTAAASPQPASPAPSQGFGLNNAVNSIKKALGL